MWSITFCFVEGGDKNNPEIIYLMENNKVSAPE